MTLGMNGKTADILRWAFVLVLAGMVSYFTAQASTWQRITAIETSERLHFDEVQRSLNRIESDLRDVKRTISGRQ